MNNSMYLELFKLVLNSPSGIAIEINPRDLKNLKVGLAKRKAIYNKESEEFAELSGEPADTITKNFKYEVDEEAKPKEAGNIVVNISLADPPTFSFTIVGDVT